MKISGSMTEEDAFALRNLVLKGFARYSSWGLAELTGATVIMIGLRESMVRHNSLVLTSMWLSIAALCVLVLRGRRKRLEKQVQKFLAERPNRYDVDEGGIKAFYNTGIQVFTPWSFFVGWRRLANFLFFDSADAKDVLVIRAVRNQPESEATKLEQLISSMLGPPSPSSK
jgi:hypothetical protein